MGAFYKKYNFISSNLIVMAATNIKSNKNETVLTILWLGFVTGTLDAMAALIWSYSENPKVGADIIFEFIASGVFGKAAFTSGGVMIVAGLVLHYLIAFLFTMVFYLLYPLCDKLIRNKYVIAILYGTVAWLVMNLAVVPLSKIGYHSIKVQSILIGIAILIVCIGLPVALVADKKYWAAKLFPGKK